MAIDGVAEQVLCGYRWCSRTGPLNTFFDLYCKSPNRSTYSDIEAHPSLIRIFFKNNEKG